MINLPIAFTERMKHQLGTEADAFFQALQEPATRGLRRNPMRGTDSWLPEGTEGRIPWAQDGYYLSESSNAGNLIWHEAGAYYIQDPGAMLPAEVLNARPGEYILDMCAAPGGKSTQIACAMQGQGILVANEVVPKRCAILSRNLERMGVTNALCISMTAEQLSMRWPECFDAVLVDAPCSGEGMFRKAPETMESWSPEIADGCIQRQKDILSHSSRLVCPGGRMVYSTCTFHREENEGMMEWFLNAFPEFELESFQLPGIDGHTGMATCYPHRIHAEGQFVALLRKRGTYSRMPWAEEVTVTDRGVLQNIQKFSDMVISPIYKLGNTFFHLQNCPVLAGIKTLRAGLQLGELRGKLFIPDHAFALSWTPPHIPVCTLSETDALRYMAGEMIPVQEDCSGYVLAAFHGLVLGFGKVTAGNMKNHYPKGLRRQLEASVG